LKALLVALKCIPTCQSFKPSTFEKVDASKLSNFHTSQAFKRLKRLSSAMPLNAPRHYSRLHLPQRQWTGGRRSGRPLPPGPGLGGHRRRVTVLRTGWQRVAPSHRSGGTWQESNRSLVGSGLPREAGRLAGRRTVSYVAAFVRSPHR